MQGRAVRLLRRRPTPSVVSLPALPSFTGVTKPPLGERTISFESLLDRLQVWDCTFRLWDDHELDQLDDADLCELHIQNGETFLEVVLEGRLDSERLQEPFGFSELVRPAPPDLDHLLGNWRVHEWKAPLTNIAAQWPHVPRMLYTEREGTDMIRTALHFMACHEMDELIRLDGNLVYPPHHGQPRLP